MSPLEYNTNAFKCVDTEQTARNKMNKDGQEVILLICFPICVLGIH